MIRVPAVALRVAILAVLAGVAATAPLLAAAGDALQGDGIDDSSDAPLLEPGPCVRDANTACLLEDRFEVRVTMRNHDTPPVVSPGVIQTYSGASSETDQTVSF